MEDGFASIFGGPVGKAVSITMAETPNAKRQFIQSIGGIDGTLDLILEVWGNRSVLHSDVGQEGNSLHFEANADKADAEIGCLYNGGLGKVLGAIASNITVRRVILEDLYRAFGDDPDHESWQLLGAFEFLLGELAAGENHTFDRAAYAKHKDEGMPVVVLGGKHPTVLKSALLVNFRLDTVGNPTKAHENGLEPYRNDLGRIALGINELLTERQIPTRLFIKAAVILGTAVRGLLVAADADSRLRGTVNPVYLPLGIVGNANRTATEIDAQTGKQLNKRHTTILVH
jgi:hypothetical protein